MHSIAHGLPGPYLPQNPREGPHSKCIRRATSIICGFSYFTVCEGLVFQGSVQVLLSTEMNEHIFFYATGVFFQWQYFGLSDKQRGSETSGLLCALSGAQRSELPACDYLN